MVQVRSLKCKFDQIEILMVLQSIYHTLEDVLIILHVPLNSQNIIEKKLG